MQTTPALFDIVPMTPNIEDLPIPESPYYVVDSEGFYIHKNTRLGRVLVSIDDPPSHLPKYAYNGHLWPAIPKIPASLLGQAWSFFREALSTLHSEAAVLLLLDDKNEYSIFVPKQIVDHTSVNYKFTPDEIPEDKALVGTIHSHCDFSAFHSGTDETDAGKHDGVHLTLGKVDTNTPEADVMVSFNGVMWKKQYTMVDVAETETFDLVAHNPEWLERLTVHIPTHTKITDYIGGHLTKSIPSYTSKPKSGWSDPYDTDDDELEIYYRQTYGLSAALTWPSSTDYAYNTKDCLEQMEYDLNRLVQIARTRGISLTFNLTA